MAGRGALWVAAVVAASAGTARGAAQQPVSYQYPETRDLVALVDDAAKLVSARGEKAFPDLRQPESRFRHGDIYVFVIDLKGNMRVHPDPQMEGKNEIDLKDIHGKPIIRGLIDAATSVPGKAEGWYHYEWPVPGEILPRWKSSYVRLVTTPSGTRYVVGGGMYDDRMERAFVVDMVERAVSAIEQRGQAAFHQFRDPTGPFIAKDAYIVVVNPDGVELVNPAFPTLEGRNCLELKDTRGAKPVRAIVETARARGTGWVDYLWPKPGESASTQKSAYVARAKLGDRWVAVTAGVYLADAPKVPPEPGKMDAAGLRAFVDEAGALLARRGEAALPELEKPGSKWRHGETYVFVWTLDGKLVFHPGEMERRGEDRSGMKDVRGRPFGKMFLEVARSRAGRGWVHYLYPKPGGIFPAWKSAFIERVTFPSGKRYLVGAGVYDMQMDRAFIEDVVDRAALLVAERGPAAFPLLRDKRGPFVFMDTYVFVDRLDGVELVNAAQPSLEGRDLIDLRDAKGKLVVRDYIAATEKGPAWVGYHWYKPGRDIPTRKESYVRRVRAGGATYLVGAGLYPE